MKFNRKLGMILLFITIISIPVGGMLSATMAIPLHNVIIVMDNYDPAITDAVNTLTTELDQYKMVQYGSFEYLWVTSFKRMNNAIFVGHGLESKGVLINGQLVDWQTFASIANNLQTSKIHFLNCGSDAVRQYIDSNKIGVTFNGSIDAIQGALLISLVSNPKILGNSDLNSIIKSALMQKLVLRYTELSLHPKLAHFLILGFIEAIVTDALFILNLLSTINLLVSSIHGIKTGIIAFIKHEGSSLLGKIELFHLALTTLEVAKIAIELWKSLIEVIINHNFLEFMKSQLLTADFWLLASYVGFFLALLFSSFITTGASGVVAAVEFVLHVALQIASWKVWYETYQTDLADPDDTYGTTDGSTYDGPVFTLWGVVDDDRSGTGGGGGGTGVGDGTCTPDSSQPAKVFCP